MDNSRLPGFPENEPVMLTRPVPENLAPYVRDITGFYENGQTPIVRKELPVTFIPLILILGDGYTEHDALTGQAVRSLERSFICGLSDSPAMIGTNGWSLCIQVNFTPVGAWKFLQLDLKDIAGQNIDLSEAVKELNHFENQLLELSNWPSRFNLLESVLQQRLLESPASNPRVQAALKLISDSRGEIKIQTMATRLNCSRKHLLTLFNKEVGLSPKMIARLTRFESAYGRLRSGKFDSLADLAIEHGYSDQAHFNHDFMAFSGENPTSLVQ